jgi:hypothetical protein
LVGSANAANLHLPVPPPAPALTQAKWAVQVGAFSTPAQAREAAAHAQTTAGAGTRAEVLPLQQGKTTLYRARVIGLTQPTANQACDRLRRQGACAVLSPDAQS